MLNIWENNLREEYHESSELNENYEFGKFLPKSNIYVYEFERRVPQKQWIWNQFHQHRISRAKFAVLVDSMEFCHICQSQQIYAPVELIEFNFTNVTNFNKFAKYTHFVGVHDLMQNPWQKFVIFIFACITQNIKIK